MRISKGNCILYIFLGKQLEENDTKLLSDKEIDYDTIVDVVRYKKGGIFLPDSPVGT